MPKTERDGLEVARGVLEWFETENGRKAIEESERRMAEIAAILEKGREIDQDKLHEPFTL
jgi:hypothetical protein